MVRPSHSIALIAGALLLLGCASETGETGNSDGAVNYPPLQDGIGEKLRPTLFVANKRGDTLSKIDLEAGEEVLRKPSCTNPHELATSPDDTLVALACYGGTTVDIFRTDTLERVLSVDLGENARSHGIVWAESGIIYATAEGRQSIFRIDADELGKPDLTEFPTRKQGSHMLAVSPDETAAWTTDIGSKTVTSSGGRAQTKF